MTLDEKEISIHKYLDAHLKRRWSMVYDTKYGTDYIIETKNNKSIVRIDCIGRCTIQGNFFNHIVELYDIYDFALLTEFIGIWIQKRINKKIVSTDIRYFPSDKVNDFRFMNSLVKND